MDRRTMLISTAAAVALAANPVLTRNTKSSPSLNALFDLFMKENLDLSPIQVTSNKSRARHRCAGQPKEGDR
jgi:hypothetical protein